MVEVDEGDSELARAKHQVRLMELQAREASERMAKLERKVLVAVELAATHHEEADRMRRLRDQAALEHAEERRFRHEAEGQEASLRADLAWATKEMAQLRATAESYAVRQEAIRRALDAAGVVAVEAAGAVPAEERVRRLAAERDEAKAQAAEMREELCRIENADRFNRSLFEDDSDFAEWVRSRARHARRSDAGRALLDQVGRLRWVVEEWERWREAGPGEGPMPRRGDAKEALGEVDPRNAEAWARRLAESR